MAKYHGKAGVVKFGATVLGEVIDFSAETAMDVTEDYAMGDTAKTYEPVGDVGHSGTVSGFYDPDGSAQGQLDNNGTISLYLYPEGLSGNVVLYGLAEISGVTRSVTRDGFGKFSFTFRGALTLAALPL